MRISKYNGFALISVLFFLHLFSLMGLMSLRLALLSVKTTQRTWRQDKNIAHSNQILDELEIMLLQKLPPCQISPIPTSEFIAQSRNWWIQHACEGEHEGSRYRYVIESLGHDECAKIRYYARSADYFRLTLIVYPANGSEKIMLQSTLIRPKVSRSQCDQAMHEVLLGEQMRRRLM
jgi:hypothetical protein